MNTDIEEHSAFQRILIIKQVIRSIIITGNLKTKINLLSEYIQTIKKIVVYVSSQVSNATDRIIDSTQDLIISRTVRGYLYPSTYESLLLELIQVLEYAILISLRI